MSTRIRKKDILNFLMMLTGCCFYGVSTSLFLAPNHIVAGGMSGLGVIVNTLFPIISIGIVIVVVNLPILIFAIKVFKWRFVLKSLFTIVVLSLVTDLFALILPITDNALLASLYGGVCQGIGIGLFVRSNYSSGGTELLARLIVHKVKVIKISLCLAVFDGVIVVGGAVATQSPINLLYALIVIFGSAKISDIVIMGLDKSKLCIIVSDKGAEISESLLRNSPRGITMWNGKGMYTETAHNVLLTCIKSKQLTQLKEIVRFIDPSAFIIIQDSVEVRGKGFSDLNERDDSPVPILQERENSVTEIAEKENEMPFDQHYLMASVAPRKVFIVAASDDD